jgi:RimJ/RimL family protein N-acetyltransferase
MSEIKILDSSTSDDFKKFLLNLSKNSLLNFNHFGSITKKNVKEIVEKELNRKDKIKFYSFINNKLIAYSFLTLFEKPSKKHNCILGIVVDDSYQNKGYGKEICEKMVKKGWNNNLEKIWLTVQLGNKKAIKLYKSLGFNIEGIFLNDEEENGKYQTIISMAIFKNQKFSFKDRLKIWKNIDENIE